MMSLARRIRAAEQMDDPSLDVATYDLILDDLARVNRWTLAARPTLAFLRRAIGRRSSFRLLDVGFGHGDMLRRIATWAEDHGVSAELVGVDLNPNSRGAARAATPSWMCIDYRSGDYRDIGGSFDFVISNMVAHHMTDFELASFIGFMELRAAGGWMINDLHRHPVSHFGYPILARLIGAHPVVREDGTLSIARAFRPAEWRAILAGACIPPGVARIKRYFPFRLCVERLR